jgi:hypothetical protein
VRSTVLVVTLLWLESSLDGGLPGVLWLFAGLMLMLFVALDGKEVDVRIKSRGGES